MAPWWTPFTPDTPPRSGRALRLWEWYTREAGEPPRELVVCRPGRHQRAAGAASYIINNNLLIYDVDETVRMRLSDADLDRATGDRHMA